MVFIAIRSKAYARRSARRNAFVLVARILRLFRMPPPLALRSLVPAMPAAAPARPAAPAPVSTGCLSTPPLIFASVDDTTLVGADFTRAVETAFGAPARPIASPAAVMIGPTPGMNPPIVFAAAPRNERKPGSPL